MSTLPTPLRRQLENAITRARTIADGGARKALEALAVHEPDAYGHMDDGEQDLRRKLRAQAKQLGDKERQSGGGACDIGHLVEKLAYDQWHRLLFARFLLENNLLISPEHGVSVTLDDCEDLAPGLGLRDAWAVAARFAARELPEIFRADDPAGAVDMPVEDRNQLIQLVMGLPVEVYTASDSLGWCYQFWQAERKREVNDAGVKIGADELPAVTQLFTEDYMVDFLLDNTIGAWHAGKILTANCGLAESAQTEEGLRNAAALPRCPWSYLRFIKADNGKWAPAAGTFDGWPKSAIELKCLDPCMGSGHFVVGMFERLVALRMAEEQSDEAAAVSAVIRDNLFGLEIDPRCTQIAAFNLALAAWRRTGHCALPPMNLACSGMAPNTVEHDWLAIVAGDERLRNGMDRLYRLFKDAPTLGSLIDPGKAEGNLVEAAFHELQPLLKNVLAKETKDDTAHELAVTAQGLAKAAEILAAHFTLVATNVPYLGRGKQDDALYTYCETAHQDAKADLATCFLERCLEFCSAEGTTASVTPQNWLFQSTYHRLREKLLRNASWEFVVTLGPNAFQDMNWWAATTALLIASNRSPSNAEILRGLDVSSDKHQEAKARMLCGLSARPGLHDVPEIKSASQAAQLANPRSVLTLGDTVQGQLLGKYATCVEGLSTGDGDRFIRTFWQLPSLDSRWEPFIQNVDEHDYYAGRTDIIFWEKGDGVLRTFPSAHNFPSSVMNGFQVLGGRGLRVRQMNHPKATVYLGEIFGKSGGTLVLKDPDLLTALWCYLTSPDFGEEVNKVNPALYKPVGTFLQVPFDVERWQKVAAEKYPHGLPKPFSSNPTQWLFNGHPAGADQPLHVAVARLLGYQWPRQTGSSFPDCPALGMDGLETLTDDDGIVCLSATKGEEPAVERLRRLLVQALGDIDLGALIASAGPKGSKCSTLEDWLREDFFEQHSAIFQQRPFIWHIWDGHKSGFSALVNYHKLTHANLENLTYAYLGDWIRRQQVAVDAGEAGSDARLQAAKQLQARLKLILEGEPPFDIFVRWKPLSQQAIGWYPDLNDGVRVNIRPFLAEDIPGGKRGAGILRTRPNIKWEKDRGAEPPRDKDEFPWFWGWDGMAVDFAGVGTESDGNRWNDCHYTNDFKRKARERAGQDE